MVHGVLVIGTNTNLGDWKRIRTYRFFNRDFVDEFQKTRTSNDEFDRCIVVAWQAIIVFIVNREPGGQFRLPGIDFLLSAPVRCWLPRRFHIHIVVLCGKDFRNGFHRIGRHIRLLYHVIDQHIPLLKRCETADVILYNEEMRLSPIS